GAARDVRPALLLHAVAGARDPDRREGAHAGRIPRRPRRGGRGGRVPPRGRVARAQGPAAERLRGVDRRAARAPRAGDRGGADDLFEQFRAFTRARAAALDAAADLVVTHDALAAGFIEARPQEGAWAWRCHLDVSRPQRRAWTFLRQYVVKYDAAVFSLPAFAQRLPIPQFMLY